MDIPKKPLAVSRAKKKLPVELDWGPGIPKDRLRYINAKEEALIQRFRKTKAARDYAGIPAYPDPGDTAAGEKGKGGTQTGKTTGSGSTAGGTEKGGKSSGPSGAGQGPNSPSGTQKSPASGSKSAPSSPKSPSAASPSPSTGSKAPNAAAQAASDKLKAKTSAPTAPKTNAGAPTGGSKAPNAAAAAASQKLNATSNALKTAQNPKSIQAMINSGSTAPNAAAQAAYDKQKMRAISQRYDPVVKGAPVPTKGTLAGASPADFVRSGLAYNVNKMDKLGVTDARRIVDGYNNIKQFADVTYNPDQVQKITDRYGYTPVGIRANNPGNMRPPRQEQWQEDVPGYAGPVRSPNGTVYQSYTDPRWGLVGQNELLGRYHDWGNTTINSVVDKYAPVMDGENTAAQNRNYKAHLSKMSGWGLDQELTREQVQSLGPYKTTFENGGELFAGGPFGGTPSPTQFAAEKPKLGAEGLDAALKSWNPPSYSGIPAPSSTGMLGPEQRDPAAATAAGLQQAAPQAPQVAGDPRVSMPPGSYPQAPEMGSPPGYFSQFGMTQQDMNNLQQQAVKDFSFGQLMEMRKNIDALPGFMGPITKDQERMAAQPQERELGVENYVDTTGIRDPQAATMSAPPQQAAGLPASIPGFTPPGLANNFRGTPGQAYTGNLPGYGYSPIADGRPAADSSGYASSGWGSSPSTFAAAPPDYSPEAAPGDAVPEDGPMYSDSPIQGPSNPMQEGPQVEDPAVKSERQKKYATRGATIGSVIAGPIGAIVGGTLGWQMGKTTPGQRRAIASNPQALNANVQSINQLAEERGGKGNPQMQVTPKGFKDVLTDPIKVLQQPAQYTDLEQMLAALAAGIDPETGKPI